jgi:hypothetical protein
MRLLSLFLGLGLLTSVVAGCDSGDPNTATTRTYVGTLAGSESGAISVTIEGGEATATFSTTKTSPELSGSFNAATGALALSGGGYTFTGVLTGTLLSGTWTGPNGTSGYFTTTLTSGSGAVTVYCGGFDGSLEDGTLNIVIRGTSLTGLAVATDGDATELAGEVDGNDVEVWVAEEPATVVATGVIEGTTLTGTFNAGGNAGSWDAAVCTP